jgi:hypothetical protein
MNTFSKNDKANADERGLIESKIPLSEDEGEQNEWIDSNEKIDLMKFEEEQRRALLVCELLYREKFQRPTKCVIEGCNNTMIYNSGFCIDHAF